MTAAQAIWHGTAEEGMALADAISHNCECKFGLMGVCTVTCAAHDASLHDQRFMDGLVFMRRKVRCLLREEFLA